MGLLGDIRQIPALDSPPGQCSWAVLVERKDSSLLAQVLSVEQEPCCLRALWAQGQVCEPQGQVCEPQGQVCVPQGLS